MKQGVFVYGSLMHQQVWGRVVKGAYTHKAAWVQGFVRLAVPGETYPALVAKPEASTQGLLWLDVSADDLKRLDDFEGSEYTRTGVQVTTAEGQSTQAWCYVWNDPSGLDPLCLWDPDEFVQSGLNQFLGQHVYNWESQGQRK